MKHEETDGLKGVCNGVPPRLITINTPLPESNERKQLRYADITVCIIVILNLCAFALTNYYVARSITPEQREASIDDASRTIEANPLAGWILRLKHLHIILRALILPAFIVSTYIFLRRKWGVKHAESLQFYAQTICLALIIDVVNDASIVLGVINHAGTC